MGKSTLFICKIKCNNKRKSTVLYQICNLIVYILYIILFIYINVIGILIIFVETDQIIKKILNYVEQRI